MLESMSNLEQRMSSYKDNNGEYQESSKSSASDTDPLSPFARSPWFAHMLPRAPSFDEASPNNTTTSYNGLMGSLVREEGHIYSLATSGDLLYTGSDSKNIRVWKNQREYSGFKSNSGLVKSIVISAGNKVFTGHQDGKIRVWKISRKNPSIHKRIGTLPTLKAFLKSSLNPSNYIDIGRNRNAIWLRHFDAISSLGLSEDHNYLYSASWDKTIKVWRTSNFKCLESISAHDDAVNAVVAGFDALVFTGSADGTVKIWRREVQGKGTKHFFSQYLLKQECAVTTLTVDTSAGMVYCGSSNGQVNFWDKLGFGSASASTSTSTSTSTGGVLRGHKLAVLCMTTTGCLIFSGSADMSICVWRRISSDTPTNGIHHLCLSVLTGHNGPVKCLAVVSAVDSKSSLDTNWILYSGSLDKSIKLWRISERIHHNVLSFL